MEQRREDQPDQDLPRVLPPTSSALPPSALTAGELVSEIRSELALLLRRQIELARTELREDVRAEALSLGGLGAAGLGVIITVTLLLVTAILALARVMPPWGAGLAVSGAVLLVSGAAAWVGWSRRVRKPLQKTRASLKEDLMWAADRRRQRQRA